VISPPSIGPTVGPIIVPTEYQAIGRLLDPGGKRSETTPPPIAIGAPPKQPAIKRNTMTIGKLELSAQAMVNIRKKVAVNRNIKIRPIRSVNGPKSKGPTTKPRI
jgi:hypothetical protein